jgi:hypothetical protein
MRFAIVFGVWVSLATTTLLSGAQFSETRELPPLKLAASELDAILTNTDSVTDAANGPEAEKDSSLESVTVRMDGQDIEIPHFSLASSLGFPKEIFSFSYSRHQGDKPISSVTIDLGDSSRRISVNGGSAEKVSELSNLLENDFRRYSTPVGGIKFRRLSGVCLSMFFLTSLMASSVYCCRMRSYSALGMPICSALGFLIVVLLPWNRLLPGFVLYQQYSPFFLVRHASQAWLLALLATLVGIPLSYFLARRRSNS